MAKSNFRRVAIVFSATQMTVRTLQAKESRQAVESSPFPKVLALFGPFWKSPFLSPFIAFLVNVALFELFLAEKVLKSVCSCMRSQFPSARRALARRFFWSNKLVKLVPGVHNAVKSGFFNFTSCFAFRDH